jgi:thioredoxin reductase (NADPH)
VVNEPVILVVDDDPQVLSAIRRDLRSRYREDYRVLSANSGESALDTIGQLKARGDALALIVSDQRMPVMLGVDLLAKSREFYPIAKRVLLTAYSDIDAAVRAINEAHLDHYLGKPWDPPEERLFPVIDDLLSTWQGEYRPEVSGIRLIGNQWSLRSHEVKHFLASNLVPYRWLDIDRDPNAASLLEATRVDAQDLPALILEDGTVLRSPTLAQVADCLCLNRAAAHDLYDLVIIGAGPAGLAAAVYGASEGMRTLLLDGTGPGGQAGASSKIENYLGFPTGVSGTDLTQRAVAQARRFGAEILAPVSVSGLSVDGGYKRIALSDGKELVSRTVIIATGMTYRELDAQGVSNYIGAGVYYGTATTEAHSCRGCRVIVAGGGNSAGQSAVHLSRFASEVVIVIRRQELSATMSHYLIQQLASLPNVRIRTCSVVDRIDGQGRMQKVWLKSLPDGSISEEAADALFIFIGTRPHSDWLPPSVMRDTRGFVLTGHDVRIAEGFSRQWKEDREPMLLETSVPGVFAAGDVRAGAMNRVASAVAEGSIAVRLASDYLSKT